MKSAISLLALASAGFLIMAPIQMALAECAETAAHASAEDTSETSSMTQTADANDAATEDDPEAVVEEIVEDAEPANDGTGETHAETGAAEPRENWFGCSPDSDAETCEQGENPVEEAAGDDTTTEDDPEIGDQAMSSDKPCTEETAG